METVLKSPNVEVEHVQPVRLRNTEGRWRVIVNMVTALYIYIYTPCIYTPCIYTPRWLSTPKLSGWRRV